MDNFVRGIYRVSGRRGPGPARKGAAVFLAFSLLLPGPAARAAEFEITADSFTVVNQVNLSSVTYFQARASAPPDPALATQLLSPGGLYFDATYYNVWDRTSLAWVKLATGTAEAGRVAKAGDFMSGQLTTASTITVQGSAFSVGASTFVVIGGKVGVGTTNPIAALHAVQGYADATPSAYFRKSAGTSAGKVLELKTDYNSGDGSILEASNADGTAVVIKNSGDVGIGTASPESRLHIKGTGSILAEMRLTELTATGGGSISGQLVGTNGGVLRIFTHNNSGSLIERMRINESGSVGIGTTAPAEGFRLDVSSPSGTGIRLTDSANLSSLRIESGNDISTITAAKNGAVPTAINMRTQSASGSLTDTLTLSGGNVGIGTTGPGAKLDIKSSGVSTYPLRVLASDGGNMGYFFEDAGQHAIFDLFDGGGNNDVRLNTNGDSWLTGGNVGVGTASPAQKLDVSGGNIQATGASGGQASVYVNKPAASDAQALTFRTGGVDKWNLGVRANNSYLEFWDSPAGTSMFTILAGGNVGVGAAAPTAKLHVGGTPGVDGIRFPDGTLMTTAAGTSTGQSSATDLNLAADSDANGSGVITLATAAQERVRVANNGNVGIRTNDPISLLTVKSTAPTGGPQLFLEQDNASDGWLIQAERNYGDITFSRRGDSGAGNVTERLRIKAAGNVGIGTTSPQQSLHVAGSGLLVTGTASAATASSVALDWFSSGARLISRGADTLTRGTFDFNIQASNGSLGLLPVSMQSDGDVVLAQSAGNVGVGTTSPSDALHVYRDYDSAGSRTSNAATLLVDGAPGKDAWLGWGVGGVTSFVAGFDNGEKQLDFWGHNDTSWNHTLAMTTTGQVGIGTRFPYNGASSAKLDVRGRLFVTDPGDIPAGMYISRSGGPTADWNSPGGTWGVYRYGSAQSDRFCIGITGVNEPFCLSAGGRAGIGAGENPAARLHVSSTNAVAADTILQVSSGTSAGQELLVVKGDGKVGVGTTGPGAKLQVGNLNGGMGSGTTFHVGDTNANNYIVSAANYSSGGYGTVFGHVDNGSNDRAILSATSGDGANDAFVTSRFVVKTNGNVGVGTNPGYKLDVNGDLNLAAGGVYRIGGVAQSGSSKWTAGTGDNIYRTLGRVGVGTGDPTHGKIHAILGSANGPMALQAEAAGVGTDLQWYDNDDAPGAYKWDFSYRGSLAGDNLHLYRNPGSPDLATTWTIGGRVGVGAGENPAARLHVSSANAVAADTILQVSSGTSAGQELFVVKGDGRTGIGIAVPEQSLHVKDASGSPGRANILIEATGENAYLLIKADAWTGNPTATLVKMGNTGNLKINNASSSGLDHLVIDNQGQVGVGAVPAARLHVSSANAVSTDTILQVSSGTSTGQELLVVKGGGRVGIGTANPAGKLHVNGIDRVSVTSAYNDGTRDYGIYQWDNGGGSGNPPYNYFQNNVGIGTVSPGAKLEVLGDIKASNFQNSWTSYTPTTSLGHAGCVGRYIVMGKIVYVQLYVPGQALTTGASGWTISLPLTSAANLPTELVRTVFINASSTRQTGLLIVGASASNVDVYTGPGLGAWSSAGTGSGLAGTLISYPID